MVEGGLFKLLLLIIFATASVCCFQKKVRNKCDRPCEGSKRRRCVFKLTLEIFQSKQVDGRERLVLAYNKIIPGPPIVVCEQDDVVIHFRNAIDKNLANIDGQSSGTTLHLHGIREKHSPWSDGVPYVTQCPILPNGSFTYRFNKNSGAPPGTYWYHSHVGSQRTNGAYGVLIVKPQEEREPKLFDIDISSKTLILQEWYHSFTYLAPVTLLVNGKGRAPKNLPIFDTTNIDITQAIHDYLTGKGPKFAFITNPEYPKDRKFLTNYEVFEIAKSGKRYLFRIIGAISQNFPLKVSIEDHKFEAIATDTLNIKPVDGLTALWITAGERYDIVVHAKPNRQSGEAFKIKIFGTASDVDKTPFCTIAWLRYPGQTIDNSYITPENCDGFETSEGRTLNPVPDSYKKWNEQEKHCPTANSKGCKNIYVHKLRDVENQPNIATTKIHKHYFGLKTQAFNNLRMSYPTVPFLLQDQSKSQDNQCVSPGSGQDCQHVIHERFSERHRWVETILINPTEPGNYPGTIAHPIHQHSGWFWVVGQGQYPEKQIIDKEFIMKEDKDGKLKRSFVLAPPKDTIQVPTNGYVIHRTKLNNAGTWLVHCHIDFHFLNGMAMVLQIGELGGPPSQKWNTGNLTRNDPCEYPPGNPHEIFWFENMNPDTHRCVKPGTNVTFVWEGKFHNVNKMAEDDWNNCIHFDNTNRENPTHTFPAPASPVPKTYYFACGVGDGYHCKKYNMKAKVLVHDSCIH